MMELTQGEREDLESGGEVPWTLDPDLDKNEILRGNHQDCGYDVMLKWVTRSMAVQATCSHCQKHVKNISKSRLGMGTKSLTPSYRREITASRRFEALMRSNGMCETPYCSFVGRDKLVVDHMYSLKDAADDGVREPWIHSLDNLAALCPECNSGKGRKSFPDWAIKFIREQRKEVEEIG